MPQDPYSAIAQPAASDPYAAIAAPIEKPGLLGKDIEDKLPGTNDTGLKGAAHHIQDTLSWLKGTYDVSAPGIAQQIYKKLSGQPNEMKQLPGKMVTAFALADVPEGEAEGAVRPPAEAPVAEAPSSGMLSRVADVAKRRLNHIPGVQAAKDAAYILGGETPAPPAPPAPAPPSVPEMWGKGQYGTPVDQWGQRIQQPMAPAVQPVAATPAPQPMSPTVLQQQIEQALGNEPLNLKPNVPLREQLPSVKPKPADIPEGHTPVDSSAVKSFKYDADAKEFHAKPSTGKTVYVYGDVSPEEAEAFAKADSKGKAWMQIRNNPLVAKIVDGKRIAVKPVASDDLTSLLQQSLDQAKAVKAAAGND